MGERQLLVLDDLDGMCEGSDPELLLDPYNPLNDQFFAAQRDLKRKIQATKLLLKPKYLKAVELFMSGKNFAEIGRKLKADQQTISKHINTPNAQYLIKLLYLLRAHDEGPQKDHRQAMLYRIAVDNLDARPSIAISALQEINKMQGSYEQNGLAGNQLNITINNELLPRTTLDDLPRTHDVTPTNVTTEPAPPPDA